MKLAKIIATAALPFMSGCIAESDMGNNQGHVTGERAMRVLGVDSYGMMASIKGYVTLRGNQHALRHLAAIVRGTGRVRKSSGRNCESYSSSSYSSEVVDGDYLELVLKKADRNGDKIITQNELLNTEMEIYRKYGK